MLKFKKIFSQIAFKDIIEFVDFSHNGLRLNKSCKILITHLDTHLRDI